MSYRFEIDSWLELVVARRFKTSNTMKLLRAILAPVKLLIEDFTVYRKDVLFKVGYSCQQRSLASLLNQIFKEDIGVKTFLIITEADIKPKYFAPKASDASGLTDSIYAGLSSEPTISEFYAGFGEEYNQLHDFIVFAPIEVINRESEIRAWVNYYRFASKKFTIQYI